MLGTSVQVLFFYKRSFPNYKMEKVFTPEERRHIAELLKKHRPEPREEKAEEQKETTVTSQKGITIVVKSEVAGPSKKPFKERTPKKLEEASKNMN